MYYCTLIYQIYCTSLNMCSIHLQADDDRKRCDVVWVGRFEHAGGHGRGRQSARGACQTRGPRTLLMPSLKEYQVLGRLQRCRSMYRYPQVQDTCSDVTHVHVALTCADFAKSENMGDCQSISFNAFFIL